MNTSFIKPKIYFQPIISKIIIIFSLISLTTHIKAEQKIYIDEIPVIISDTITFYKIQRTEIKENLPVIKICENSNLEIKNIEYTKAKPLTFSINIILDNETVTKNFEIHNPEFYKDILSENFDSLQTSISNEVWKGNKYISTNNKIYKSDKSIIITTGGIITINIPKNETGSKETNIEMDIVALNSSNKLSLYNSTVLIDNITNPGNKTDLITELVSYKLQTSETKDLKITLDCQKGKYLIKNIKIKQQCDTIKNTVIYKTFHDNQIIKIVPEGNLSADIDQPISLHSLEYFYEKDNYPSINPQCQYIIKEYIAINRTIYPNGNDTMFTICLPFKTEQIRINDKFPSFNEDITIEEININEDSSDKPSISTYKEKISDFNGLKANTPYIITFHKNRFHTTDDTKNINICFISSPGTYGNIKIGNEDIINNDIPNNHFCSTSFLNSENNSFNHIIYTPSILDIEPDQNKEKLHPFSTALLPIDNTIISEYIDITLNDHLKRTNKSRIIFSENKNENLNIRHYSFNTDSPEIFFISEEKGYSILNIDHNEKNYPIQLAIKCSQKEIHNLVFTDNLNKDFNYIIKPITNIENFAETNKSSSVSFSPIETDELCIFEINYKTSLSEMMTTETNKPKIQSTKNKIHIITNKETSIEIFDITGIMKQKHNINPGKTSIDVPAGIYILKYHEENVFKTLKLKIL